MKEEFYQFLRKHRVVRKFNNGLFIAACDSEPETFDEFAVRIEMSDVDWSSALLGAFVWRYTEEGVSFWSDLDYKWQKEYDKQTQ